MRWQAPTLMAMCISVSLWAGQVLAGESGDGAGRAIYDSYCGACHGFDGLPLLPNTPNFAAGERMEKPDSELLDSIRVGKGTVMPPWVGILNDEECEQVLKFIRSIIKTDAQVEG